MCQPDEWQCAACEYQNSSILKCQRGQQSGSTCQKPCTTAQRPFAWSFPRVCEGCGSTFAALQGSKTGSSPLSGSPSQRHVSQTPGQPGQVLAPTSGSGMGLGSLPDIQRPSASRWATPLPQTRRPVPALTSPPSIRPPPMHPGHHQSMPVLLTVQRQQPAVTPPSQVSFINMPTFGPDFWMEPDQRLPDNPEVVAKYRQERERRLRAGTAENHEEDAKTVMHPEGETVIQKAWSELCRELRLA